MKRLAIAFMASVLSSGIALAQQGGSDRRGYHQESAPRAGDPDRYSNRAGDPNPYATRGGDPNPYATRGGDPNTFGKPSQQDSDRRSSRQDRGVRVSEPLDKEQLPYGTGSGARRR